MLLYELSSTSNRRCRPVGVVEDWIKVEEKEGAAEKSEEWSDGNDMDNWTWTSGHGPLSH